jgi:uncharacterized zinc-type alcohol dehydrogenase-like protein
MGIKIAKALGATVTAISTSPQKEADAKAMGASNFLLSTDAEAMGKARDSLSLSLSCLSLFLSLSLSLSLALSLSLSRSLALALTQLRGLGRADLHDKVVTYGGREDVARRLGMDSQVFPHYS